MGRYLEIVFYLDEDANNRLWYVSGSNGNVLFTRTFEEVYEKYQGILSGEVVLLDSEFFSQNFKTVIAAREDMLERLKLIEGRSRITGQNLSKLSVSGYDHEEGEALVHAEGLTGESKTGVNVYPDVVSEVTVSWEDLITSRVKVFDFSRCCLLRSFEIGSVRYARYDSNESISLIFSGSAQRMAYGSFYPNAKEVRVIGTKGALSIEDCQNLSKVYIKCVADSSYSGLNLARIAGETEAGRGLSYQSHTSIRELGVECSSFSCSERLVDITREFPDLEKLCLTGNLEINQSDFVLVVPRDCKVDCSDRRLRSKVVSRQE